MFVAIGYIIVLASVFGGFAMAGGHLAALFQPLELVMIGGAALGAFVTANGGAPLKATLKALPTVFKGAQYSKAVYMELFALLFELLSKVRKEGLMSIEGDVENPEASPIFSKYPKILADHHLVEFITDYLRLMVGGSLNAFEIENLMDVEIETHHHEGAIAPSAVNSMADGMPAFGGAPPAELGLLIAKALVGTFLGILLGYGFIAPLAKILEYRLEDQTRILQTVKVTLLASLNGYAPQVAVEFGRKVLASHDRPSFKELEDHVKQAKAK